MTGTMAFGLGLGTGMVVTTVTILVTLGRLGKARVNRHKRRMCEAMKKWDEQRQARLEAIANWPEDWPEENPFVPKGVCHILANDDAQAAEFLLDAIQPRESRRADDTPRDGLDTWGFVG